ncbi:MAG: LacI family DNA-binding transcriptional regulator [Lachnospiraceae bacterium]
MTDKGRTGIRDVAEAAGVSLSSVSRYLNNGYVSEEKREKIRKAIEETGYAAQKPEPVSHGRKTGLIGVIIPRLRSETIASVVDGIQSVLGDNGYQMLLTCTEGDEAREVSYIGLFGSYPVDGIILSGTVLTKMHRIAMKKTKIPIVTVGQHFDNMWCVYHDDVEAGRLLTDDLIQAGCRKPAMLAVRQDDISAGADRLKGYKEALSASGMKFNSSYVREVPFTTEGGYIATGELMVEHPDIDGFFCATDSIAIGAMQKLEEMGFNIPRDVKVCGVGHSRLSRVVKPKLTTAHLFYGRSGSEAARMLLSLIDGKIPEEKQIRLPVELVKGQTTAAGQEDR